MKLFVNIRLLRDSKRNRKKGKHMTVCISKITTVD